MTDFAHLDDSGQARMVNVGAKRSTLRIARASARIEMRTSTWKAIQQHAIAKGEVLPVARVAGILAAKQTPSLIPLCHPVGLDAVTIEFQFEAEAACSALRVQAEARVHARTGVEMEALTAVSVAALTVYDMCKSIDREMRITDIQLEEKSGGKSGHFLRKDETR